MRDQIDLVLSRLRGVRAVNKTQWRALCPCHKDDEPSLSIAAGDKAVVLKCHACDATAENVADSLGLKLSDLFYDAKPRDLGPAPAPSSSAKVGGKYKKKGKAGRPPLGQVVATYDYHRLDGSLAFQVLRYERTDADGKRHKTFRQRQPAGDNKWSWSVPRKLRTLYRLPEVEAARKAGQWIAVVEGEKDADRLWKLGLAATTPPGGAKEDGAGWEKHYTAALQDAYVAVIPDNDRIGLAHARAIAAELHGTAKAVRVVEIPDAAAKEDVSDFLDNGGTPDGLRALVHRTPNWEPPPPPTKPPSAEDIAGWWKAPDAGGELWLARLVVRRHGQDLRFIGQWRRWIAWTPERGTWRLDVDGEAIRRAKYLTDELLSHAVKSADLNGSVARDRIQHTLKLRSNQKLSAAVTLAATEPPVVCGLTELDRDPWLFNVNNGTLDLRTGKLSPHRRRDMMLKAAPAVAFDAAATAPKWTAFLNRILPDDALRSFVQRLTGYWLTGVVREHVLPFLYGQGANGKSVFVATVLKLLGDYAAPMAPGLLMDRGRGQQDRHPTELADLHGMRLVAGVEVPEYGRLNEPLLKYLTGGDEVKARRMREDFWAFDPTHKLAIVGNHRPRVSGADEGVWRRLRLVPFTVTIPEAEQDKLLKEKVYRELPGILNWALAGCREWAESGLREPPSVLAATREYREDEDVLGQFLLDCVVPAVGDFLSSKELHGAYAEWCEEQGSKPLGQRTLTAKLKERGLVYTNNPGRGWRDIRLRQPYDQSPTGRPDLFPSEPPPPASPNEEDPGDAPPSQREWSLDE